MPILQLKLTPAVGGITNVVLDDYIVSQELINSLDVQRSQRKDNPKPSKTNHFKAFVKRMEKLKMEDELSKILYTSSKTEKLTFNQLQEQRRVAGVSTKGHGVVEKGQDLQKKKEKRKKH